MFAPGGNHRPIVFVPNLDLACLRHALSTRLHEDWYFVSHSLPIARAVQRAGFEVHVTTRVADHAVAIEREGSRCIASTGGVAVSNRCICCRQCAKFIAFSCARNPPSVKWSDLKCVCYYQNGPICRGKKYKPDEIFANLRQVDVLVTQRQTMSDAIRQIGVGKVTFYRWRQEFGGLKSDQGRIRPAMEFLLFR